MPRALELTKECRGPCGKLRPLACFYSRRSHKFQGTCKVCRMAQVRAWQKANRKRIREYQRALYARRKGSPVRSYTRKSAAPAGGLENPEAGYTHGLSPAGAAASLDRPAEIFPAGA